MQAVKRIHELSDSEVFDLGWFPNDLKVSANFDTHDLQAFELRTEDLRDDDDEYELAIEWLERESQIVIDAIASPSLFVVEHTPQAPSRLRSYKGLLRKHTIAGSRDVECCLGDGRTLLLGIAPFSRENRSQCFPFLLDQSQSFLLLEDEGGKAVDRLVEEVESWVAVGSGSEVLTMDLIAKSRSLGCGIATIGIDTRGDYVSMRFFGSHETCLRLYQASSLD
jgi:hypothetical protein